MSARSHLLVALVALLVAVACGVRGAPRPPKPETQPPPVESESADAGVPPEASP